MAAIANFIRHAVRNPQAGFGGHAIVRAVETELTPYSQYIKEEW